MDSYEEKIITIRITSRSLHRIAKWTFILALAGLAYATAVLWNSATNRTSLTKARFIELTINDINATGAIRPGETVNIAPSLTNNGDINCEAFIRLKIPEVEGEPAYVYEVNDDWNEVERDSDGGYTLVVYGYGSKSELDLLSPGLSTSPIVQYGFTLKESITGVQFWNMTDVDIEITGYLIDEQGGADPVTAWAWIQQ